MLGVVSGNTPESPGRVLDLLRLASPDALVRARAAASPHVVLALPDNVDAGSFLAELWRTPLGRTPLSDHYDLAPLAAGIDHGAASPQRRAVNWPSAPTTEPACPIRCSAPRHRTLRVEPWEGNPAHDTAATQDRCRVR
ncbi:hypothetical protein ABZ370_18395 [Streptomyces sp. NPDC005962]|uniref:hypothetical protein n=1 Tax=Streptomyces sp. NPDC005962 TaxID=3154466 RepID=UPI0033EC6E4F